MGTDTKDLFIPKDTVSETLRKETSGVYIRTDCRRLRRGLLARSANWDEFIAPFVHTCNGITINEEYDSPDEEQKEESKLLDGAFPVHKNRSKRIKLNRKGGSLGKNAINHNKTVDIYDSLNKLHPSEKVFENFTPLFLGKNNSKVQKFVDGLKKKEYEFIGECANVEHIENSYDEKSLKTMKDIVNQLYKDSPNSINELTGYRNSVVKYSGLVPINIPKDETDVFIDINTNKDDAKDADNVDSGSDNDNDDDDDDVDENDDGVEPDLDDDVVTKAGKGRRKAKSGLQKYRKRRNSSTTDNNIKKRKYRSLMLARFTYDNKLHNISDFGLSSGDDQNICKCPLQERCVKGALGLKGKDPYSSINPPDETTLNAINRFYDVDSYYPRTAYMGPPPADSNYYGIDENESKKRSIEEVDSTSKIESTKEIGTENIVYGNFFTANGLAKYKSLDIAEDGIKIIKTNSPLFLPEGITDDDKTHGNLPTTNMNWRQQQKYGKYGILGGLAEEYYRRLIKYPKETKLKMKRNKSIELPKELQEPIPAKSWRSAYETDAMRNSYKALLVTDKSYKSRFWKRRPISIGLFGYKTELQSWRPNIFADEEDHLSEESENDDDNDLDDDDDRRSDASGRKKGGDDDDDN